MSLLVKTADSSARSLLTGRPESLIRFRNLEFSYTPKALGGTGGKEGTWRLLAQQLEIRPGTIYQVLGDNMSGKSTLLRIMAGLESVHVGLATEISGSLIRKPPRPHSRTRLRPLQTCLLSASDTMFPEMTLWENVALARSCGVHVRRSLARTRFHDFISRSSITHHFGITQASEIPTRLLGQLSSGAQSLMRLARPYTWRPALLLMDEVSSHLDDSNAQLFYSLLAIILRESQCAAVVVSHIERDRTLISDLSSDCKVPHRVFNLKVDGGVSCVTADSC